MDLPSDLIDLLSAFEEEQVDYLLVGGQAVALHGVQVPGGDFEMAYRARATFSVGGVTVSCVSKVDLIAQKRASGRPQDLVDAANLERE
jgi:hypothetical protein